MNQKIRVKIKQDLADKANWEMISTQAKIKQDKLDTIAAKYQPELDACDPNDFESRSEIIERMTEEASLIV